MQFLLPKPNIVYISLRYSSSPLLSQHCYLLLAHCGCQLLLCVATVCHSNVYYINSILVTVLLEHTNLRTRHTDMGDCAVDPLVIFWVKPPNRTVYKKSQPFFNHQCVVVAAPSDKQLTEKKKRIKQQGGMEGGTDGGTDAVPDREMLSTLLSN